MSSVRRVVFDTSTLVGVALKPGSVPHRALGLALQQCEVCMSAATLAELDEVLSRDKFDRYMPRATRLALAELLRVHARHVEVTVADEAALQPPCRDPKDNKFLALAKLAAAEVLVSSDDDLLTLHPWCGVQVITPAAFVALASAPSLSNK
jgi:putative PIN family toxin of toxin-antitoxin system